jgi:hypothetical protein
MPMQVHRVSCNVCINVAAERGRAREESGDVLQRGSRGASL